MKPLTLTVIVTLSALLLAGCASDKFAGSSPEETTARQEHEQAQAVKAKMELIDQKKQQFQESAELKNVTDTAKFIAYAFRNVENNITTIEVEAVLTNPGKQIYEIWVRQASGKEMVRLGAMEYNHGDDYSFRYQSKLNIIGYDALYLSRESIPDDTPETIIMTGSFSTQPTASQSAEIKP